MSEFKLSFPRLALYGMPDVAILAAVGASISDVNHAAAKGGDALQAAALVKNLVGPDQVEVVRRLITGSRPTLSPVHAIETTGVNEIPIALAESLADALSLEVELSVIRTIPSDIQERMAGTGWRTRRYSAAT